MPYALLLLSQIKTIFNQGYNLPIIDFIKDNRDPMFFVHVIGWQNTIYAWFAKWLKNDSRWWNELYPVK